MPGKKWPKSRKITIRLLESQIAKKPATMTMTEWIKSMIDSQEAKDEPKSK